MGQWIDFQQTVNQRLLIEDLDQEQSRARNFSTRGHALVRGVAGSGKSLVLSKRVEKLIAEDFDNILILSYNRFMNGWLKSKFRKKGTVKNIECLTFHKWSYRFGYSYELDKDDEARKSVIELAKISGIEYQAILIDEAQDFYDEWFQAVLTVINQDTNSLFFVYDNTQSVYGQSHRRRSDWSWKKLGIDIVGRAQIFDVNYRNSPEILEAAWQFITPSLTQANMKVEKKEKNPGIGSIIEPKKKLSRSSNIKPSLLQISTETMGSVIAQQVKLALLSYPKSSIGILTHPQYKSLRQDISKQLYKLGVEHHAPMTPQERDKNVVDRPYVIVDSWNALKGVEFDAVIIAGLDEANEYPGDPDADFQEKAGIYTAMTRARDHLVMLYNTKTSIVDIMENALNSREQLDSVD
jgi:superfamily I DNA/RNA helicase